ncbi:hypothetical protein [Pseudanabaena sp. FACHB-2040]|uniref:hypothetical protein n=1 Tax=Pseudanabaena sp. FACHB-2040 TaxID=2692859 RepID=UPI001683E5C6|nr:hypothetical protein [Pseudanabaena sp. FACHB-2040]MBD2256167.1 hypothetical protein [Pseudanabaena sp. FACHB-2040]
MIFDQHRNCREANAIGVEALMGITVPNPNFSPGTTYTQPKRNWKAEGYAPP